MKQQRSELLATVQNALSTGEVSRKDLEAILECQQGQQVKASSFTQVFYYLGGVITLLGILLLVGSYWGVFVSSERILISSGSALTAYLAAIILAEDDRLASVAAPFFLIFALLLPGAIAVALFELGALIKSFNASYILSLSLFGCIWAFYCYRFTSLLVFVVLYASLYYFSLLKSWDSFASVFHAIEYYLVATLLLGIVYTSYLYNYWREQRQGFAKALSRIGMILVLSSLLSLREQYIDWHGFWEFAAMAGLAINFLLAVKRQDNFLRIIGFIAFINYIFAFTKTYFLDSLGWTLSLIISGLLIIAGAFLFFQRRK
ncbi:MAG: hypothetical protein K0S08_949 [Gammaproteobacteria bacterium]|jgi:hypothetical protein|nr:hypothetical protein [Gammaproteobacteria bacterium]